jgi:large subunit ribosomal protein L24
MANAHIKKGDEVVIISGSARGNRGKVLEILTKKNRVIVEGQKMIKRHTKKSQQHPQGAIVEREGSIHMSNVIRASEFDASGSKAAKTPAAS